MTQFIQLHVLTSYPPSNLNRDDMGRPKTARMGNAQRLRISSQSLKRHWRVSDVFESALSEHVGTRTKLIGVGVEKKLNEAGIKDKVVKDTAEKIASVFGKVSTKRPPEIEQLVHISPSEQQTIDELVQQVIETGDVPDDDQLALLKKENMAVDIALFGRMLAKKPAFNVEAACQVAHAISVQQVAIEDDYFTAVDDLKGADAEDSGAAHIGETNFASAVFYEYVCINKDLLIENLNGNTELAEKALAALVEAIATVAPSGKQNSFASRAFASYVMAEKGSMQPRSLSVAYLKPINGDNVLPDAIASIEAHQQKFDAVYGKCADSRYILNTETSSTDGNKSNDNKTDTKGTLDGLKAFISNDGKSNYE